jgi:hypothetical protein
MSQQDFLVIITLAVMWWLSQQPPLRSYDPQAPRRKTRPWTTADAEIATCRTGHNGGLARAKTLKVFTDCSGD